MMVRLYQAGELPKKLLAIAWRKDVLAPDMDLRSHAWRPDQGDCLYPPRRGFNTR